MVFYFQVSYFLFKFFKLSFLMHSYNFWQNLIVFLITKRYFFSLFLQTVVKSSIWFIYWQYRILAMNVIFSLNVLAQIIRKVVIAQMLAHRFLHFKARFVSHFCVNVKHLLMRWFFVGKLLKGPVNILIFLKIKAFFRLNFILIISVNLY